jgi:hypothetical protein
MEAQLVAEVRVERIYQMGMGVDVAKIHLEHVILNKLPPDLARRKEHLVLAFREEFTPGTRLLLVLKRFDEGGRLIKIGRISHLDRNYKDKVFLIREYVRIEQLPAGKGRLATLVRLLLEQLKEGSEYVRWECLKELEALLKAEGYPFTKGDVGYLEAVEATWEKPSLRRALTRLRESMAQSAVEGPPLIKEREENGSKKEQESAKGDDGDTSRTQ